jgi:hypothetical protein
MDWIRQYGFSFSFLALGQLLPDMYNIRVGYVQIPTTSRGRKPLQAIATKIACLGLPKFLAEQNKICIVFSEFYNSFDFLLL